jgi:sarcosine oxidase subunit beta
MKTTADAVIIGGGIQGTSLLYYLTQRGMSNIKLLEMEEIGCGATSRSAAWVMHTQLHKLRTIMTKLSLAEYLQYKEKLGIDIGLIQPGKLNYGAGSLQVGTIDLEIAMREQANIQRSLDIPADILDADQVKKAVPFMNTDDIGIGLYCEEDGIVNPHSIMYGYIEQAKKRGADVQIGVRATNIKLKNQRVIKVETNADPIWTPIVINAAGFRACEVGSWINIKIPLCNSKRHELITEPTPILDGHFPLIEVLAPEEVYIGYVGENGNQAMIGIGRWTPENFSQEPELLRLMSEFGDALKYRFPDIAELRCVNKWAGIRPLSPDGIPVLGPVEGVDGYINDCCWGGDGVAHAPIGGLLLSAFITGVELPMNLEPFLLKRFE